MKKRVDGELSFEVFVNLNHDLVFRDHNVDHPSYELLALTDFPEVEVVIDNSHVPWLACSHLDSEQLHVKFNEASSLRSLSPVQPRSEENDNAYVPPAPQELCFPNTPSDTKKENASLFWLDCLKIEEMNITASAHFKSNPRIRKRNRDTIVRQIARAKKTRKEVESNPEAYAVFRAKANLRAQKYRDKKKSAANQ